jgi:hypothetical protein
VSLIAESVQRTFASCLPSKFIQIFRYEGFPLRRLEENDGKLDAFVALK